VLVEVMVEREANVCMGLSIGSVKEFQPPSEMTVGPRGEEPYGSG
jgi:glyoxylate carboligase